MISEVNHSIFKIKYNTLPENCLGQWLSEMYNLNLWIKPAFDNNNKLEGIFSNSSGKKSPNTKVLLKAGLQNFWTTTDNDDGKFQFILPYNFNKDSTIVIAGSSRIKRLDGTNSKIKSD